MPDDVTADPTQPTSYIGQRRKRFEDVPLLVGAGAYTSDLRFDDMVELAIVRTPGAANSTGLPAVRSTNSTRWQASAKRASVPPIWLSTSSGSAAMTNAL